MITSAEEFKRLRESDIKEEYDRSAHEEAPIAVWTDVINKFPDLAFCVAHNKTVPIEILRELAKNSDSKVRWMVASKRKITRDIFDLLKDDEDESVRHRLIHNKTLTMEQKITIKIDDSNWLKQELGKKINETSSIKKSWFSMKLYQ